MTDLKKAITILKKGGLVIYPTDTAFGIGCRIDDNEAVKRLFSVRKRPISQAVPVLVDSIEMAKKYLKSPLPNNVRHLMEKYWPGGLTIIYTCKTGKVPSLVRAAGDTLGVRMPNHELALSLIKGTGVPILGPSANFHGKKTPYKYSDLDLDLIKLVDYILEGQCRLKRASTVIDCSKRNWKITRLGAIKIGNDDID